jgi:hypothetical protein
MDPDAMFGNNTRSKDILDQATPGRPFNKKKLASECHKQDLKHPVCNQKIGNHTRSLTIQII